MRWKPSPIEWLVLVSIAGLLAVILVPSRDYDSTHRFPPARTSPGNSFATIAGEYHQGAPRGRYLSLSILPDGRYSFVWSTCVGVDRRESGDVRTTDGLDVLTPTEPNGSRIGRVFLPIRWDQRRYLVAPEEMRKFCDAIAHAEEPREGYTGRFYLRFPTAQADGVPDLPEKWAKYLHDTLIIGRIVDVKGRHLRIDLGSKDGLRMDDILNARGPTDRDRRRLVVLSVEDHACTAVDVNGDISEPSITAGWRVFGARTTEDSNRPEHGNEVRDEHPA